MSLSNSLGHIGATQDVPIVQGLLMCRDESQATERTLDAKRNPGR